MSCYWSVKEFLDVTLEPMTSRFTLLHPRKSSTLGTVYQGRQQQGLQSILKTTKPHIFKQLVYMEKREGENCESDPSCIYLWKDLTGSKNYCGAVALLYSTAINHLTAVRSISLGLKCSLNHSLFMIHYFKGNGTYYITVHIYYIFTCSTYILYT